MKNREELLAKIVKLRAEGLTVRQLSERFGITSSAIYRMLAEAGVPVTRSNPYTEFGGVRRGSLSKQITERIEAGERDVRKAAERFLTRNARQNSGSGGKTAR